MYNKVMVPLDGSELAECVFPHVEAFIKGFRLTEVVFVRVIEPFKLSTSSGYTRIEQVKEDEATRQSAAKEYLDQVVDRLKHEGILLQNEVLVGKVADSLTDYARKSNIDLIIMATHGRSGVTRWVMGSIADKILRSSNIPVLMVRAPGAVEGI
jgi:nucleotide-binding universal stress UspA family protein